MVERGSKRVQNCVTSLMEDPLNKEVTCLIISSIVLLELPFVVAVVVTPLKDIDFVKLGCDIVWPFAVDVVVMAEGEGR